MIDLIITLRKEVADQAAAEELYNAVKEKLSDRPGISMTGHCSNHFASEETE